MNAKEDMQQFVNTLLENAQAKAKAKATDALRAAQMEPVGELLRDAANAATSMMEFAAGDTLWYVREALMDEQTASVPPRLPETIPTWISPWEGELASCVVGKVGKALELLSQYEWARNHPCDPMKRLAAVHAWAIEMCSKADHLEHNDRASLERGREALGEARQYMSEALHLLLRDDVTGDIALAYDRAIDAVGDALVVLSDNVLRDGRKPQVRLIRRVTSRRDAALLAYALLSGWLRAAVEAPLGDDGCRRRELPAEATVAMYRAAYLVGDCVLRDDAGYSPVALVRSAAAFVRERITRWSRATIR